MSGLLVVPGYQGSGPGHWQRWLAGRFAARAGWTVAMADLPGVDEPQLQPWLDGLRTALAAVGDPATVVVAAHSLGCHLWAHLAAGSPTGLAARVLLVAPPSRERVRALFPGLPPASLDAAALARSAPWTGVVVGTGDPYLADPREPAEGGLPTWLVAGGGHLNLDAGLGPWPALEAWVLGAAPPPGEPLLPSDPPVREADRHGRG